MKTEFQYYKGTITADRPEGFVTLERMLKSISNPKPELKMLLDEIKQAAAAGDEHRKAELKTKLFSFTPCAIISNWRNYENIQRFTGLAVLDFDKISFAKELKTYLFENYPCIVATWISPSGKGVKAIFKIPVVQSVDEFKRYFFGMETELSPEIKGFDIINQNPIQKLFIGEDPEILIRTNATEWNIKGAKINSIKSSTVPSSPITPTTAQTQWIVNWYTKTINSINTNGHPQVRENAITLGGYIGGGYIQQNEAETLAKQLISNNHYLSKDPDNYIKTALWGINEGIKNPLFWNQEHKKATPQQKIEPPKKEQFDKVESFEQKSNDKATKPEPEPVETLPELRTIGSVFDYYKSKGAKHLPDGISINSDRWKSKLIHSLAL